PALHRKHLAGDRPPFDRTLTQMWSLAEEEQFYFLWPPLLMLLLRRRVGLRGLAALAVMVCGVRTLGRVPAATSLLTRIATPSSWGACSEYFGMAGCRPAFPGASRYSRARSRVVRPAPGLPGSGAGGSSG